MRWLFLSNPLGSIRRYLDNGGPAVVEAPPAAAGAPAAAHSQPIAPAQRLDDRADRLFLWAVFAAAVIANLMLATRNWHYGFLIGHEFRQTQTAIISYYIDQQNNFSLHYQTPLLGKPWEFPLEFPLYEWAVVVLSRLTHLPQFEAARTISLTSVYLALPALYLLLGQAGMAPRRRLLALALLLATPVYLFYGRAFLIDTTAMMFSAWFLAAFVQTMRVRSFRWLALCAVAGTAAGLIKSLTFFVWLLPATLYGAWCLWCDLRGPVGRELARAPIVDPAPAPTPVGRELARAPAAGRVGRLGSAWRTIAWGVGAVIVPALAVQWWVRFTDAIKAPHPSAYIFTSKELTHGNFGMYDLSARLSRVTWRALLECWSLAIANPWAIALIVGGGIVFLKGHRLRILGAFFLFFAAQMAFPNAYAFQDYYFTACTMFAVAAIGFVMSGVFESRLPRWCRWPIVLVPFAAFYAAYAGFYHTEQSYKSAGGTGLTIALRDYLPRKSVLIIAGADWAGIIPYYSQHRALMIRTGLDGDEKYLTRAFGDLADEDVGALVLVGSQRANTALVKRAADEFALDREPTFRYPDADVYISDFHRADVLQHLQVPPLPPKITFDAQRVQKSIPYGAVQKLSPGQSAALFPMVQPAVTKCTFRFGYGLWSLGGVPVINAHPDSAVWVPVPATARTVDCEFGISAAAYERPGDRTDGADFIIEAEAPGGATRVLWKRFLNPVMVPRDRGTVHETVPIALHPGETLVFRTGPHNTYSFDWCYWKSIRVQ